MTGRIFAFAAALSLVAMAVGCRKAEDAPARPKASDGLVVILPQGESGSDLVSVRIADGVAAMLTDTPEQTKASPLWISALQRVLFVRPAPDGAAARPRLMLVDPLTGSQRSASDRSEDLEVEPAASVDGKYVVYAFSGPTQVGNRQGIKLLRPMTAAGGVFAVAPPQAVLRRPRLSPDGLTVVAEVRRSRRATDIWLLSDENPVKLLVGQRLADTEPRFSRGGGIVYFERAPFQSAGPVGKLRGGDVCGIEIETRVVTCFGASANAREYAIEPSPARDEVAFLREMAAEGGAAGFELMLSDAEGQEIRSVHAPSQENPRWLRWSPNGERIAFESGPVRGATTTVVDRDGNVLLETPGSSPTWAPYLR